MFAIDNSDSMEEEIAAMKGPVFDMLPAALLSVNGGIDDFQIGVVTGCPSPAHLRTDGASGSCGSSTGKNFMVSRSPNLQAEYQCVTDLVNDGCEVAKFFAEHGRGVFHDLCGGNLSAGFEAALEIVDSACSEFIPPG